MSICGSEKYLEGKRQWEERGDTFRVVWSKTIESRSSESSESGKILSSTPSPKGKTDSSWNLKNQLTLVNKAQLQVPFSYIGAMQEHSMYDCSSWLYGNCNVLNTQASYRKMIYFMVHGSARVSTFGNPSIHERIASWTKSRQRPNPSTPQYLYFVVTGRAVFEGAALSASCLSLLLLTLRRYENKRMKRSSTLQKVSTAGCETKSRRHTVL